MKVKEWVVRHLYPPATRTQDPVKEGLTARQEIVADRLARMQGKTRDQVLAEAYRRADKLLARRERGDG